MSHYYTPDPDLPHDIAVFRYGIKGRDLQFFTDAGVFSRQKVDYGSNLLINFLPPLEGRVLDLGCGYGPIGISLAALNPHIDMTMVDINRRGVALAKKNTRANGVRNVQILESDGFTEVSGSFSTIVSNPPIRTGKKVIYPLFEQSFEYLDAGGSLWLVIQKKQGAPSAVAKLESIFANCSVEDKTGGYWLLHSIK
jgi:16S rRNA (guanine1207-N2)-methyltransferase